jgi:hypothetical protein
LYRARRSQRSSRLIIRVGEKAFNVFTIDVEQGQIQAIGIIANPDQLARI